MSRLYDTVEPSVVDEEMLQKAVEEQGPKDEAGRLAKAEGIDFAEVTQLRLDFKNILKIDNMWCFTCLTKLQLDNNIIERIEGLDVLVNLTWLDLSFNNIEVIEGLDKLTKLTDLTLYNNRIARIENMDSLVDLHVLSIGNNDLKDLENLTYLRRFKNCKTLNLNGNPFCELEDYKVFVLAYLPHIDYLDYRLVDEASKHSAYEKYQISIEEMLHDERAAQRKLDEQLAKEKEFETHKKAYVEKLNGPYMFDSMYQDDIEGNKLSAMPGVDELLVVYRESFSKICQQIFEFGLIEHEKRVGEIDEFWKAINEAKTENKNMGMVKVNDFIDYKKKLFLDLLQLGEQGQSIAEQRFAEYNDKVAILQDALMGYEMQLVDQLEETVKDFERNMADMVSGFLENVQALISQCRDLENMHHERMMEIAIITLEKVLKNELDDDIPDELRELCVDKDTIVNAVQTSHDLHLLKIDNREDDIVTRINQFMSNMIRDVHDNEEVKRNRQRVSEINNLIDHLRDEIDNLDLQGLNY
ncbi:unnamed protein product [Owenia fusiformis]|uniref:Dynein regulatory complex subunit 3 n=1 Tax=Owenia fusiformis TaxID=6347 RepID=A0A8J1XYG8_OWEFU|nr:unnamed protein product [Owenia fusiformis]